MTNKDTIPALPAPDKRRRVPPKVREAIQLIVEGRAKNITAAAKKVGLSREHLSRMLGEPHISEHLRQKAARAVSISSGRAAARLTQLIDQERSQKVALDASKFSLACAGISPIKEAGVSINIEQRAGYVIVLSEPGQPETRIVGGADGPSIDDQA